MTTESKPKTKIDALEETVLKLIDMMEDVSKRMDKLEKGTVKKPAGKFGGHKERVAMKDTKTGIVYVSKAALGKDLAGEIEGGDPLDHFVYYKLTKAFPDRFVEASEEEAATANKEAASLAEKARVEAQEKLDKEAKG